MKKYISAILINALLLQFVGCYSQKEITYDDFYTLPKEQEARIIFNDEKSVDLVLDSLMKNYINWKKEPDTLIFYLSHYKKVEPTTLTEVTDTFKYPKEDINKIYIEEYDGTKTILGIILAVSIVLCFYGFTKLDFGWHKAPNNEN